MCGDILVAQPIRAVLPASWQVKSAVCGVTSEAVRLRLNACPPDVTVTGAKRNGFGYEGPRLGKTRGKHATRRPYYTPWDHC